jgi:hypothetical protein
MAERARPEAPLQPQPVFLRKNTLAATKQAAQPTISVMAIYSSMHPPARRFRRCPDTGTLFICQLRMKVNIIFENKHNK